MKYILVLTVLFGSNILFASDKKISNEIAQKHLKAQLEREQKYAKEQKFYQGDDYNLKAAEVDPNSLDKIEALEPDYDFDMSEGVYSD
jgi:hypothetical protein